MPKKIAFEENIPALLSVNVYQLLLIGWIAGRQDMSPNFTAPTSIRAFFKKYHIPEELWDYHAAEQFVYRTFGKDNDMIFENLHTKIINYGKQ